MIDQIVPLWIQYLLTVGIIAVVFLFVHLVERESKRLRARRALEELQEERLEEVVRKKL